MHSLLKVLHLEDNPSDLELLRIEMENNIERLQLDQVDNKEDFLRKLKEEDFDIVMADYRVPRMDDLEALHLSSKYQQGKPFIYVSGTIGEEKAVEALRKGATDYLLKENFGKVPYVVRRVLKEQEERLKNIRNEERIRENEEKFRALIENNFDAIVILDNEGNFSYASPAVENILGYTPDELVGMKVPDIIHPEDDKQGYKKFETLIRRENHRIRMKERVKRKDGNYIWIDVTITDHRETKGIEGFVVNFQNIDQEKRAYDKLAFDAHILSNVTNSIIVTNLDGEITYWNQGAADIFGYEHEEMLGRTPELLYPDQNIDGFNKDIEQILGGKPYEGIWKGKTKDDRTVFLNIKTSVLPDADGNPKGFIGVSTDISPLIKAESESRKLYEELMDKEAFTNSVLSSLSSHIAVLNRNGKIVLTNHSWDEFARKNGGVKNSLKSVGVGGDYLEVTRKAAQKDSDAKIIYRGIKEVLKGKKNYFYHDYPCHSPDEKRWYTIRVTPLETGEGCVVNHENITDRKLSEDEQELIFSIRQSFSDKENIDESLQDILSEMMEFVGASYGEVWLSNLDNTKITLKSSLSNSSVFPRGLNAFEKGQTVTIDLGIQSKVIREKKVVFIPELQKENKIFYRTEEAIKVGLKGVIAIPVVFEQKVTGVIVLMKERYGRNTSNLKSLLSSLGVIMGYEIRRKEVEKQLKDTINLSDDLICISGFDGYLRTVNPAFSKLLGFSEKELLSKRFRKFIHPNDVNPTLEKLLDVREKGVSGNIEHRVFTKSGEVKWLTWTINPMEGGEYFFGFAKDITESKEIQKKILANVIETQEKERKRFARDLHDSLNQMLVAAKMNLMALKNQDHPDFSSDERLENAIKLIKDAVQESRNTAHGLISNTLQNHGLWPALEELTEQINKTGKLELELDYRGLKTVEVPENIAVNIYRIVQECLNNTIKHSGATKGWIKFRKDKQALKVSIGDNGKGFKGDSIVLENGVGIQNIKSRCQSLNADIKIKSLPREGVQVECQIPLKTK